MDRIQSLYLVQSVVLVLRKQTYYEQQWLDRGLNIKYLKLGLIVSLGKIYNDRDLGR